MSEWITHLQWPAMVASIVAAYLVGSSSEGKRNAGFWVFLTSNVLWVVWALPESAWALVSLQFVLAAMNIRGLFKTEKELEQKRT